LYKKQLTFPLNISAYEKFSNLLHHVISLFCQFITNYRNSTKRSFAARTIKWQTCISAKKIAEFHGILDFKLIFEFFGYF